jgi:cytochrome c oxidase subunit 2
VSTEQAPAEKTMGVDPFERNWMIFSIALLLVFFALITIAGFALGFQVPGVETEVDPATVTSSGPWSQPGLRQIADGEYEAYVVARTFAFDPRELEIPVGSKVTIYVTSVDVQHGFKIQDTNINMQIVPGQVSKLSYTFDRVGEFPYICTEYCGLGHAAMYGTVNVVQPGSGGDG